MKRPVVIAAAVSGLLAAAVGCSSTDSSAGSKGGELVVTVSAEGLGANGYPFPPTAGQEVFFVDGWEVKFDRILATIDNVRLSEMPDKNPGNQGEVGSEVVRRTGPWVVDAVKPGNETDKGGAGKVAIRLPVGELKDIFDLEQRYAFSFDLVPASTAAQRVNIDTNDVDYQEMVDKGYRVLFVGTATLKAADADCKASSASYDFSGLPKKVQFRFGFAGGVSYVNCQNPDNTGTPIGSEESQRGIQMLANAPTYAQITVHTDHIFWSTIAHENVPMFNQFAANARLEGSDYLVTLADLAAVPISPVTDSSGNALPWRSCVADSLYKLPSTPPDMTFDAMGQPLTNLRDFVAFNAATMGHLNADGLCFVATQ
jgi:hypothetical protein